jgi:hypothetical protein
MAQQAWQAGIGKSDQKMLLNMPVGKYAKIFPDSYDWVKKFAMNFAQGKKIMTMKQLCKKIGYEGKNCLIEDFSMWACLFADPAFTQVSVEELEDLAPAFEAELKKSRKDVKMWPHPAVVFQKVRKNAKEKKKRKGEEVAAPAAKRGKKESLYKHIFWHELSGRWRATVHYDRKTWKRKVEHFEKEADAVKAVKEALNKTSEELLKKKKPRTQYEDAKTASMYEGVFYDTREGYRKKWMAVAQLKKRDKKKRKKCKGLGHFSTQLEAAKAMADFKKVSVKELRKRKAMIYGDKHAIGIAGKRFQILTSVFVKRNGPPAVPADYEASKKVAKNARHKKMFKEEPATALASIGLKYGPCKEDLLKAWQARGKR